MMKMVLATVAALSLGSAAFAADGRAPADAPFGRSATALTLQGLDLATTGGQQRLAIRVDQAAREVCGNSLATIHADLEARARACRADVAEQVRSQIELRVARADKPAAVVLASLR